MMMALLKIARVGTSFVGGTADSFVDLAGYALRRGVRRGDDMSCENCRFYAEGAAVKMEAPSDDA